MKTEIKHWLYISLLITFTIIILFTILSFQYVHKETVPAYLSIFVKYHTFFMFSIAILGIIFGSITQLISSKKIEENTKKYIIIKEMYLTSLPKIEQQIIQYLIQNKGISTQYELTKIENLNKLKVSRALIELEQKKIITKQKIGKINKVFLNNDLYEALN